MKASSLTGTGKHPHRAPTPFQSQICNELYLQIFIYTIVQESSGNQVLCHFLDFCSKQQHSENTGPWLTRAGKSVTNSTDEAKVPHACLTSVCTGVAGPWVTRWSSCTRACVDPQALEEGPACGLPPGLGPHGAKGLRDPAPGRSERRPTTVQGRWL